MSALLDSCSELAGELTASLAALLRGELEVALAGIDRISYGEFLGGLELPTYFNLLQCDPPGDCFMLAVEPALLYPMIDRLLGGGLDDEPAPCRPLSDIELSLAGRIVRVVLDRFGETFGGEVERTLSVVGVEANPRLLRALPSDEMVMLVRYRVTLGRRQGVLRLCLPCRFVKRLREDATDRNESGVAIGNPAEAPGTPSVEVHVTLATTAISEDELHGLRLGDILATETDADGPAQVSVAGQPKYVGRPGVWQGRMAVCITGPASDEAGL
ncbi:MAG: FliM/FliN family flagellar motor switch protein [Thermoguttaceae bacterium]